MKNKNHVTDRPDVLGFDKEEPKDAKHIFHYYDKQYRERERARRKLKSDISIPKTKFPKSSFK